MSELYHHGILGMKWGVRRTPEELGHTTGSKSDGSSKRTSEKSQKNNAMRVSSMSDDELRQRISRLQMEENYATLLAREKERTASPTKKLMSKAFSDLGNRAVGIGVEAAASALRKKISGDKFDVHDYLTVDAATMDEQTAKRVKDWYTNVSTIERLRAERQKRTNAV